MNEKPMPPEEGGEAPAPKAEGMDDSGKAQQIAEGVSQKAVDLMNGMQELGFVLSELGIPEEQLQELAGQFNAFLQTIQAMLGGGGEAQPEMQGEGPAQEGIPYEQGMATAGKNKARPMVG